MGSYINDKNLIEKRMELDGKRKKGK
jgi:hypothetical protein